ncbi:hypothetical protein JCM30237_07520 [Halolamina litorea]|uniref:DUF5658 domain-containing protein n=1 Tax=Halolamina litorea TaxID=1515593 RepID=A0ABD6BQM2_9EURY|nr:hypothetical protein [Halolamina litorea]
MTFLARFSIEDTDVDRATFTQLWIVATATYGVGDVVTTIALLWYSDSVREANALVRTVTDAYGLPGFVVLKIGVFVACILISVDGANAEDRVLYYLPPVTIALIGAFTTSLNLRLLLG